MTALEPCSAGAVIERRAERPCSGGDLIADLTAAAERVLDIAPIKPDDDLFDMGCDSIQALTLLMDIEALTGQSLTPSDLYEAPTIGNLAALLAAPPSARSTSLIVLRPGDPALPPIFMAPGLGSTAIQLLPLASALDTRAAIYGLEPAGLAPGTVACETVEHMAAGFADDVRRLSVDGHCHLLGFCFGGLVALEIARQLTRDCQDGARGGHSLMLINTYPHTRYWSPASRAQAWVRLLGQLSWRALARRVTDHHLPALRGLPWHQMPPAAARLAWRGVTLPLRILGLSAYARDTRLNPVADPELPSALKRVKQASALAFRQYLPPAYTGEALLVTARPPERLPYNPTQFWRRRIRHLEVEHFPSEPPEMLGEDVGELARIALRFMKGKDVLF
jgi:thioesterase domain-containing protein/acyl carrier protein